MKDIVDIGYTAIELCCDGCEKKKECEAMGDNYAYEVLSCLRRKLGKGRT